MTTPTKAVAMADRAVLSVHTKPETSERLSRLAETSGRTKSALANEALETFLDHQEWMTAEIEKGMADARAGRVIEHADMKAFVTGLSASAAKTDDA